jgi:transposase
MAFDPMGSLREWKQKVARLQERWRGVRQENEQLRKENEQLRRREKQLEQEREQLRRENEKLKRQLEEAQRASKRQAAPFFRGTRKQNPQRPGRKSGSA